MAIWVKRDGNELIVGCDDKKIDRFNRTRARSRALETLPPAYDLKNGQREEGAFIFHIVEPAQASQRLCPKAPDGGTHHLAPKGPAGARVLTCVHCRRSQREIERDD